MKKYFVYAVLVILLAGIIFLAARCARGGGTEVKTGTVQRGRLDVTISATGTVRSNKEARLTTVASGKVLTIYVEENQAVKEGMLLLELDSATQAKKDFIRMDKLGKKGYVAPQDVEHAREQWKNTLIRAPFEGSIAKRFVDPGEVLAGGAPALLIADLDDLVIETNIDETDIGSVGTGQGAIVELDAYKGNKFDGKVSFIAKSSLEQKEKGITYLVKIKISPSEADLRLGMTGDVTIHVKDKADALTVPYAAVGEEVDKRFVYKVTSRNRLQKVYVKTGLESYEKTEIVSGLNENDIIAVSNIAKLKDGQKVKPAK